MAHGTAGALFATVAPRRQPYWDWRAAANFIGGGSGAGLLAYAACAQSANRLTTVLGIALLGAGLLCVWLEIGRPARALNVFRHPGSWMTYEAWVALPLLAGALVALVYPRRAFDAGVAVLALAYLYCQARMLAAARGIPAWRHPLSVPLWIVTGLAEGSALGVLVQVGNPAAHTPALATVLVVFVLARVLAFAFYRRGLQQTGAPQAALAVLARLRIGLLGVSALSAACAMLGVFGSRAWPGGDAVGSGGWLALSALLSTVAGWWLKYTIVTRAGYQQGFALPLTPERGRNGTHAGTRPGW